MIFFDPFPPDLFYDWSYLEFGDGREENEIWKLMKELKKIVA